MTKCTHLREFSGDNRNADNDSHENILKLLAEALSLLRRFDKHLR